MSRRIRYSRRGRLTRRMSEWFARLLLRPEELDVVGRESTIYERLGQEAGIKVAVDDFYYRVLGDDLLRPYFAHMGDLDLTELKRHQVRFLSQATDGPKTYDGLELAEAHAGRGITPEAFDRVVFHLLATLEALGVHATDQQEIVNRLGPLKPVIAGGAPE